MEQRYKRAADWDLITSAAQSSATPVIGNGDILTLYEVRLCTELLPDPVLPQPVCNGWQKQSCAYAQCTRLLPVCRT